MRNIRVMHERNVVSRSLADLQSDRYLKWHRFACFSDHEKPRARFIFFYSRSASYRCLCMLHAVVGDKVTPCGSNLALSALLRREAISSGAGISAAVFSNLLAGVETFVISGLSDLPSTYWSSTRAWLRNDERKEALATSRWINKDWLAVRAHN